MRQQWSYVSFALSQWYDIVDLCRFWHQAITWCKVDLLSHPWNPDDCFKDAFEFTNLTTLRIKPLYETHIFQCMGKTFHAELQMVPLKFHIKIPFTHTVKSNILNNIEDLRPLWLKHFLNATQGLRLFITCPPDRLPALFIASHSFITDD